MLQLCSSSNTGVFAFFAFIITCLVAMTVWEVRSPGGAHRHGILGLETTRGDRLFISHLTDGEITSVYVENAQAVQYGERLFAIRPTT